MCECLRNDRSARLALQRIIANSRGGIQRGLYIPRLKTPSALLLGSCRPHPRKAIRLQLQSHAQCIRLRRITAFTLGINFPKSTKQILHVMADFMTNDIRMCKLAGRPQLLRHHVEKSQI